MRKTKGLIAIAVVGLIGFSSLIYRLLPTSASHDSQKTQERTTETIITPTGGDFKIQSTQGVFNTQDQRGQILFIAFGFLSCPHICPLTISRLEAMHSGLSEQDKKRVRVLFVSVDNKRDSLERLRKRFKNKEPHFIGASAADQELNNILKLFGARFTRLENKKTQEVYIDHTTQIFVVNSRGEWADTLAHDSSPEELLQAFREADKNGPLLAIAKKERIIEVLGANKDCDLSEQDCEVTTFNNKKIKISFSQKPITIEKDLKVNVTVEDDEYRPLEVDIEGTNYNMGYIRPQLKQIEKYIFSGDFYLPVCEVSKMKWKVKLIAENKDKNQVAFIFNFTTKQ